MPVTVGGIKAESAGIERRGESTTALLSAARQGQNEALGLVLESYRAYLTVVARKGLGRALAARVGSSDLVQETFYRAQRQFGGFRGETEAEWRSWLGRILHNLMLETARRHASVGRSVHREVPFQSGDPPAYQDLQMVIQRACPSGGLIRREEAHALLAAITDLPEHYRQVVTWHHQEGVTFEEIADRLDTTAEAARKLWVRALVRLRDALGPSHDPKRHHSD